MIRVPDDEAAIVQGSIYVGIWSKEDRIRIRQQIGGTAKEAEASFKLVIIGPVAKTITEMSMRVVPRNLY